jgi:hypothetical protein
VKQINRSCFSHQFVFCEFRWTSGWRFSYKHRKIAHLLTEAKGTRRRKEVAQKPWSKAAVAR